MKRLFYFLFSPFVLPPTRRSTTATDSDSLDREARADFERASGNEPDPGFRGYEPPGLQDWTRRVPLPIPRITPPSLPASTFYDLTP